MKGLLTLTLLGCDAKPVLNLTNLIDAGDLASTDLGMAVDPGSSGDLGSPGDLSIAGGADLSRSDTADLWVVADMPLFCEGFTVATLAGDGTSGYRDGAGNQAEFNTPWGLAVDSSGTLYVTDMHNRRIRKIHPDGTASTLTGNGVNGFADGSGAPGGTTSFQFPSGIAVDSSGTVYVADVSRVRKVAPDGTTTTLAGSSMDGFVDGTGGPTGTTEFNYLEGIALDGMGFLYASDAGNQRIRKIAADGSTTTLAGNGTRGFADGTGGASGSTEFNDPNALAFVAPTGNLLVAEFGGNRIRVVAPNGSTTTLTGNGVGGNRDGTGGASGSTELFAPAGVAPDADGSVYVGDQSNHRILRVAPDGSTLTIAGGKGSGFRDGSGCVAQFKNPTGVAVFGKLLYVAEQAGNRIRVIHLP